MKLDEQFLKMINDYHSGREVYDDDLKREILENEIKILQNPKMKFPPKDAPYFSPSAASAMDLELYMKLKGEKRDESNHQTHQRRWTKIGERVGQTLQEDLLYIEKHTKESPFYFARTEEDYPTYEEFVKTAKKITHKGKTFYLFGRPDGIMVHRESQALVGLEIKSKSTTYSKTGDFSMREADPKHIAQCVCYSIMYGEPDEPIDKFIVVYWNVTKKSWTMTDEDIEKYPDLRAFEVTITDEMRNAVLDKFVGVMEAAEKGEKPAIDLNNFTFCNFKQAIAEQMTEEEYKEVIQQVKDIQKTNLPQYRKQPYIDAWDYIREVREK